MLNRVLRAFTRLVKRPAPTPAVYHYPTPALVHTARVARARYRHPRVPKIVRLMRTSNGAWTGRYPK